MLPLGYFDVEKYRRPKTTQTQVGNPVVIVPRKSTGRRAIPTDIFPMIFEKKKQRTRELVYASFVWLFWV